MEKDKFTILKKLNNNLEEFISVILLTVMTVIVGMQVFMRYIVGNSLNWSEEILRFMFVWLAYITVSYCITKDKHARVEVFVSLLPQKGQKVFEIISLLGFVVFSVLMVYYGSIVMLRIMASNQLSAALMLPMWMVYLAVPATFTLTLFRSVQKIFIKTKELLKGSESEQV